MPLKGNVTFVLENFPEGTTFEEKREEAQVHVKNLGYPCTFEHDGETHVVEPKEEPQQSHSGASFPYAVGGWPNFDREG